LLSLSQLAKTLCPSYYCLYFLFNNIGDKGKRVSAWKRGGSKWEGMGEKRGMEIGGRNDPNIVCTYE
jgi:hypothetical protein